MFFKYRRPPFVPATSEPASLSLPSNSLECVVDGVIVAASTVSTVIGVLADNDNATLKGPGKLDADDELDVKESGYLKSVT
mgnify:CR=1 FL=1